MTALDEDRFAFPDLGEVQLIDGKHDVIAGTRVANDRHRPLGGIRARLLEYQGTAVFGAQNRRQRPCNSRQLLKGHAQRLCIETKLARQGNEGRRVGFPRWQRKAPPQLVNGDVEAQTRCYRGQRS